LQVKRERGGEGRERRAGREGEEQVI